MLGPCVSALRKPQIQVQIFLPGFVQPNLKVLEHQEGSRRSSDTSLLRQALCHRAQVGLGVPSFPCRALPSSSPALLLLSWGHEGRAGVRPALPRCRVISVLPSLCSPTMSPFMRAGMKCEALGINSATGLRLCNGPVPRSDAQTGAGAREVARGAVQVSCSWYFCNHSSLCFVLPCSQPGAQHLPPCTDPVLVSLCTLTHQELLTKKCKKSHFTSHRAKPAQPTSCGTGPPSNA